MKKLILVAFTVVFISTGAHAGQNNSIGGLIIGAGSGALMGQAIGRDTESTVVGTAVGSIIGYIIGSEMDKDERVYYRPASRQRNVYKETHVTQYHYHYDRGRPFHPQPRRCKEAEILGTVNGRAKKIYGTVCRTNQGWELVSEDPYDDDDYSRKSHRRQRVPAKGYHRDRGYDHWVRHRF